MGYGLGAVDNDLTLKDFAELTDVFYIGGTKCGALFGEALVITEPALQYRFKAYMKQHGAVLAKGWLMGLQFVTMLENGEYFEKTKRADALAMQIREAFAANSRAFLHQLGYHAGRGGCSGCRHCQAMTNRPPTVRIRRTNFFGK